MITELSFTNLSSSLLTMGPIMSIFAIVQTATQQQGFQPPASIAAQVWILTAIGAAMGLVKIALWLRGEKKDSNGSGNGAVGRALDRHTDAIATLAENDKKIVEAQQRLADNQQKSLEAINLLRTMNESQQEFFKLYLDKVASQSIEELKDFLREKNG